MYFCRKCAAESWAHERRKVHPLEWQQHFEEDIFSPTSSFFGRVLDFMWVGGRIQ